MIKTHIHPINDKVLWRAQAPRPFDSSIPSKLKLVQKESGLPPAISRKVVLP